MYQEREHDVPEGVPRARLARLAGRGAAPPFFQAPSFHPGFPCFFRSTAPSCTSLISFCLALARQHYRFFVLLALCYATNLATLSARLARAREQGSRPQMTCEC